MKKTRIPGSSTWLKNLGEPLLQGFMRPQEGVHVWVSHIDPDAALEGLDRERVKAEVEMRLALAGIPVYYHQEPRHTPAFPCLGVIVHLQKARVNPCFYIFSVEVFFIQSFSSGDDPTGSTMEMTWCKEIVGDVSGTSHGFDWGAIYGNISLLADEFVRDYLAMMPRTTLALVIN